MAATSVLPLKSVKNGIFVDFELVFVSSDLSLAMFSSMLHACTVKPRYNTVVRVHEFKIAL